METPQLRHRLSPSKSPVNDGRQRSRIQKGELEMSNRMSPIPAGLTPAVDNHLRLIGDCRASTLRLSYVKEVCNPAQGG